MNKKYFIGSVNILITIIASFLLLFGYNTMYVISNKKIIIIVAIITIISILVIRLYFSKKQSIYNLIQFICFLLNIIIINNVFNINSYNQYLGNILTNKYEYRVYNIYVLKNTTYDNINELENKNIAYLNENVYYIEKYLIQKGEYNKKIYMNITEIENDLENGKIQSYISDKKSKNKNISIIEQVKIKKDKKD